jgi:predicted ATPase
MFNLKVNNFRGFTDQDFTFKKVNILIGENSGGKSSLIKFLLLLKQSMSIYGNENKLWVDGPLVDLGRFSDFVKDRNVKNKINVNFSTNSDYGQFYIKMTNDISHKNVDELHDMICKQFKKYSKFINAPVTIQYSFDGDQELIYGTTVLFECPAIGKMQLLVNKLGSSKYLNIKQIKGKIIFNENSGVKYEFGVVLTKDGFIPMVDPVSIIENIKAKNINDPQLFNKIAYFLIAQNYIDYKLQCISFINPIHYKPERFYLKRDQVINFGNDDFKSTISKLDKLANNKRAWYDFKRAISDLGIAENIFINNNSKTPVTQIKTKVGGLVSNVVDVGYGVSLQIPIIMEAIYAKHVKKNRIIIIEQPEIHLHPYLHSRLIETLIKYSGNTTYIIETHSEHIVRKLQVLCKSGQLIKADDVGLFYFKNNKGRFEVSKHDIDNNGKITPNFPKGFYDNSYSLAMELL